MVKKKRKVSEIMMSGVTTIGAGQSVRQAQYLMRKNSVHALPVVGHEGELLGIVTSTDLIRDHDPDSTIARFMSTSVLKVEPETRIETAAELMRENEMHHLVVVEGEKVVGILSTFDLLYLFGKAEVPRRRSMVPADTKE
ncbi:MAG TPA: CBS domain-containing protein [Vicinamibacteria bacterium]